MSVRRLDPVQPPEFEFTPGNLAWADEQINKYPDGKAASAVIPLLWRAQEQNGGWLPEPAIRYVADKLGMAQIRVLEVATFYTMFNLSPVGKYFIQLCGTTPCMLRGSDDIKAVCKEMIGPERAVSEDGLFSWLEVECLGACCNAPMVQINKYFFEDLDAENFRDLLSALKEGRDVKVGPQIARPFSGPATGLTALTSVSPSAAGAQPQAVISAEELANWEYTVTPAFASKAPQTNGSALGGDTSEPVSAPEPESASPLTLASTGSDAVAPQAEESSGAAEEVPTGDAAPADGGGDIGSRPVALDGARDGGADDLKRISGVGPKLEGTLNSLGIFHFDQIAVWTKDNIDWMDDYLSFKGRIERDDWIGQARILAEGGETEFAARYDDENEGDA